MSDNIFLDTNICVYALSKDESFKQQTARKLLKGKHFISVQVVFEFMNVLEKKLKYSKKEAIENAKDLLNNSEIVFENNETIEVAFSILKKHSLQVFDSKIVASALLSDCKILYSEDMQHGLIIEKKLRIVNPFV